MKWPVLVRLFWLGCALLAVWGCDQADVSPPPATQAAKAVETAPRPRPLHLDHAQPRLQTIKVFLGPHEITTELALTQTQVATGMMFRKEIGEMEGMLFVFGRPHQTGFYMKNTTVPLSAAYIDSDGNILEIHDLHPHDENAVLAKSDQVQYVLEMKQGWFKKHNIEVGAALRTERGTLRETFFP